MKTIGLLGGMSWESTVTYYQFLNRTAQKRYGGVSSARIVMHSFDFAELERCLKDGDWETIAQKLSLAGRQLAAAGADMLLICTNTMHKVADVVATSVPVPLIHICDAVAAAIVADKKRKVALLGTAYTMEQAFYRERLEACGLEVLVPGQSAREALQRIIFDELVRGEIVPASRDLCRAIIADMVADGAEGVILGCTELPLLIAAEDSSVPLYDTTLLHAQAAADAAFAAAVVV